MKRPLFTLCIIILTVIFLFSEKFPFLSPLKKVKDSIPDKSIITVTGKVTDKDSECFTVSIKPAGKVLVYITDSSTAFPLLGSTLQVTGRFESFKSATNPGEFDLSAHYMSKGIIGKLSQASYLSKSSSYNYLREGLWNVRNGWLNRLNQIFPEKEASILSNLLLGDKKGLFPEIKDKYTRNGIAHILSISGLHVSILGLSLYMSLRKTGAKLWVCAAFSGSILILYGVMTGMSVSAKRAIIMFSLKLLADIIGRTEDKPTSLSLAAVIVVAGNPLLIKSSSFLLSFGSAAGIYFMYPSLKESLENTSFYKNMNISADQGARRHVKKFVKGLSDSLLASLSITITTLPITLWFFYEYPMWSVFLNLMILPLMSLLVISALLAMLIPGGGIMGSPAFLILKLFEFLCEQFDKLPFHTWNPGRPTPAMVVAYYVVWMIIFAAPYVAKSRISHFYIKQFHGNHFHSKHFYSKHFYALIILLPMIVALPKLSKNTLIMLDVGQGDGMIYYTDAHEVYLFDGGSSTNKSLGEYVLKPALKYFGLSKIDAAFVSHPDTDHVSGILDILKNQENWGIQICEVILPECETTQDLDLSNFVFVKKLCAQKGTGKGTRISYIHENNTWKSGKDKFTCLHPAADFLAKDANEMSECILLKTVSGTILFTGDVQGEGEINLKKKLNELQKEEITDITVLKVSHHGSKHSTTDEFLDKLDPKIALISAGRDNRYGHPHRETIERLESVSANILNTKEKGAIILTLKKDRIICNHYNAPS